ncbi:diacylglycerol kinase catalytic subunit [Pseudoalteromonas sp. A25]|uniref:diacylglycerol kinase family protein n=1 Tax=Pseudoalteromonas sp. A25 TaxID=116092 RepID=UPI0012607511|nr:diacylglycerol kinase family protein [Pseudoalteromonas sp. A25]BBN80918.1 diacylglycerol kinase catalytic subunit [Pseudoalteromonas sp. A25]
MKMTKYYLMILTACLYLTWLSYGGWFLFPIVWLTISVACVTFAYATNYPSLFRKSATGAIPFWVKALFLPYLLATQLYNALMRHNDKVPAIQEITPNLFLACRLFPTDIETLESQGINAILDVTAEFDGLNWSAEQEHLYYLNLPVLDHYSPSETQLLHAINWIKAQHQLGNKVVVHCALGRGRSFFMLCAYLLATEPTLSERQVIEKVQSIRNTARLNKKQLKRLLILSNYIKEHQAPNISLIVNPVSGGGKWQQYANQILGLLSQRYMINCHFTDKETDVTKLVQSIAPCDAHTFVACGGDGTVAEVAAAIKNTHHRLAILPMGTANALAHVIFGIGSKVNPFSYACNALLEHHIVQMDTLLCNDKTALLVVALGIEEKMITYADRELKNQHGQLAYIQGFMDALLDSKPLNVEMQVDSKDIQKITSSSLAIANAAPMTTLLAQGGGAPDWQDGMFDITQLEYQSDTSDKLLSLTELLNRSVSEQPKNANVKHQQGKSLQISASKPFHYCIDGEIEKAQKLHIKVLPKSLSVVAPPL